MMGAAAFVALALAAPPPQETASGAARDDAARHLIFLAEHRPIFVRLRVTSQGRPFEASWIESVRALHATLDRDGNGILTTKEADPKVVGALVRLATGAAAPPALRELDAAPKDGKVSIGELAEALRPILGPFQLQVIRQAIGRTDALFEHLDRDKDGALTRAELAAIAGSLRPLDFDDDEMIGAEEIELFNSAAFASIREESSNRPASAATLPPVVELFPGESTLRPARLLLKKYDKGNGDTSARPDNKLSPSELAIDEAGFASADKNGDGALDTDELRKFLGRPPVDLTLEITLEPETSGRGAARVEAVGALPKGAQVQRARPSDLELAIGQVRLDMHIEDGARAAGEVARILQQRFKAADTNKNGYLEGKEQAAMNSLQSPLAVLWHVIDRDGDGNIYLRELMEFVGRQQMAARLRLVVTTIDQGRAIFGIADLDRDRRLGAREVMRAIDRVMSWDSDGDGRVTPDEIPYHFQVNVARGGLPGLTGEGMGAVVQRARSMGEGQAARAAGPEWFQKMDRNHDRDVSRREFLGPRDEFDRLDRDKDGLIDADEARAAEPETASKDSREASRPWFSTAYLPAAFGASVALESGVVPAAGALFSSASRR
jgi:Ca2+-binding EF-hand superfamily protein